MAEMPFDVLVTRLGRIRDGGDIDFDHVSAAMDIDQELQDKYQFITQEEIDAAEIEDCGNYWQAGSGPEAVTASRAANPNWLFNKAVHALALYQHLLQEEKRKAEEEAAKLEAERKAKRPAPGPYLVTVNIGGDTGKKHLALVTGGRRIMFQSPAGGPGHFVDQTEVYDNIVSGTQAWTFEAVEL